MIILLLIVVWPFLCVLRTVLLIVIFSVLPQGVWEWKDVVCVLLPKPGSALNFLPDGKLVDDCWVGLDWIGLVGLLSWCACVIVFSYSTISFLICL